MHKVCNSGLELNIFQDTVMMSAPFRYEIIDALVLIGMDVTVVCFFKKWGGGAIKRNDFAHFDRRKKEEE